MYLLATAIPIYVDGPRRWLDDGWFPDVLLAREWLARDLGELTVIAPWAPLQEDTSRFHEITPSMGIRLVPVFDATCRRPEFWTSEASHWRREVRHELARASVLHTSMDDITRPMALLAFQEAVRAGVPTVFVGPDMDLHEVWSNQERDATIPCGQDGAALRRFRNALLNRLKSTIYVGAFDWAIARVLRRADLALLKEGAVHDRYARFAAHPKAFCHTMYSAADVIPVGKLEGRLAALAAGGPLRLVYCGRLIRRKGLALGIRIVEYLRRNSNIDVYFDLIGSGPEEEFLRAEIEARGLSAIVTIRKPIPYGPHLLRHLAGYDAMLYTPLREDTPRMLYDGYAAGLPFIATSIPFARYRANADGAGVLFPIDDVEGGARQVEALDADRSALAALSRRARKAGIEHSVEKWYGRRAEWTKEAIDRRRRSRAQTAPS